jgi:parvulin-like peptidyl-prolyl isomerase
MPILVNNQLVDDQLIREEARLLRERIRLEMPGIEDELTVELQARQWARENVIMRVLLQQASGSDSPDEMMARLLENIPRPKQSEIAAHYKQFRNTFRRPEMVRAAHIVKNVHETSPKHEAEAAILDIERKLKSGANFAQLADLYSDCPGDGGDLGFFARGEMVPEFDQVVFALRLGEISGVFRSPFGFHIAKVIERREAGIAPLLEVREQIEQELWLQKRRQTANDFMENLRAKADIRKV